MRPHRTVELLVAGTAASAVATPDRARELLDVLRPAIAFDGAWLAVTDPLDGGYRSLASVDLTAETVGFLAGPTMARDIEITGTDRARPPLSPSELPYPAGELLSTWADCLMPSGIHEALAVALFTDDGRHVGLLALLSGDRRPPSSAARRELQRLAPVLAHGIDPMRPVAAAAGLVRGATAGVVLRGNSASDPLPGLPADALFRPGSPLLAAVRDRVDARRPFSTFLWPVPGHHAPVGHVRVTVLAVPAAATSGSTSVALLSPPVDLRGLTPRELEVLGLLVEGCSNQEIARALVIAPRTAATHLEHVLVKLDAPTRTLAAVRAERGGLFVPSAGIARRDPSGVAVHADVETGGVVTVARTTPGTRPLSVTATSVRRPGGVVDAPGPAADFLSTSEACSVLDTTGELLAVNDAWTAFEGASPSSRSGVGANYLEVCRTAAQHGAPRADATLAALTAVLSARQVSASVVYPCALPGGLRWFRVEFAATAPAGRVGVRHVDVTDHLTPVVGSEYGDLLADDARCVSEAGLLVALEELLGGPARSDVVVMVSDRNARSCGSAGSDRSAPDAVLSRMTRGGGQVEVVGRLPHDVFAAVVTAAQPHAAAHAADAVVSATSDQTSECRLRWGFAVRTPADDAGALLARARRSLIRTTRIDLVETPADDSVDRSADLHRAAATLVDALHDYDRALDRGIPMSELVELDRTVQRSETACVRAAASLT